jgi:hypothetical protein
MQVYLNRNTTICTPSTHKSLLHVLVYDLTMHFPDEFVQVIKTWIRFLKCNDYDFELQDELGRTPLLDHLTRPGGLSLAIVRLLLEFGANSHAVDSDGCNAIQLAMSSKHYSEFPEILEEKLSSLIEAGVDLHHRSKWGYTSSHYARFYYKCWAVWCRALERNGRKIDDVVREDGELWLLEESDEEESDEEESDEEENGEEERDEEESDKEESVEGDQ